MNCKICKNKLLRIKSEDKQKKWKCIVCNTITKETEEECEDRRENLRFKIAFFFIVVVAISLLCLYRNMEKEVNAKNKRQAEIANTTVIDEGIIESMRINTYVERDSNDNSHTRHEYFAIVNLKEWQIDEETYRYFQVGDYVKIYADGHFEKQ